MDEVVDEEEVEEGESEGLATWGIVSTMSRERGAITDLG